MFVRRAATRQMRPGIFLRHGNHERLEGAVSVLITVTPQKKGPTELDPVGLTASDYLGRSRLIRPRLRGSANNLLDAPELVFR
jgi:hypothetical protein